MVEIKDGSLVKSKTLNALMIPEQHDVCSRSENFCPHPSDHAGISKNKHLDVLNKYLLHISDLFPLDAI